MRPFVRVLDPDGTPYELVHGDIIGRLWSAAMPLDDGRVSEAHAMVSLREEGLHLIALRGAFAVDGKPESDVALQAGMRIQLARGLFIEVADVTLPDEVLGLEGPGFPRQSLPSVASLLREPAVRLVAGYREGAVAHIWGTGDGWRVRVQRAPVQELTAGDDLDLGDGVVLRAVAIPLRSAGQPMTRKAGGVDAPMSIVAQYDVVHLHRDGEPTLVLSGMLARTVSELVACGGPMPWAVLAGELWPRLQRSDVLRSRLDVNLSRLRRKLREAHVRTDLVRTDGTGLVELVLTPYDRVEDRS